MNQSGMSTPVQTNFNGAVQPMTWHIACRFGVNCRKRIESTLSTARTSPKSMSETMTITNRQREEKNIATSSLGLRRTGVVISLIDNMTSMQVINIH